jgi:hypothetical protein
MTRRVATFVAIAFIATLQASTAHAQQGGGPGGGRKHKEQKTDVSTAPKADEKAYNAALKSLPNKPYDPWFGAR